jgi:phosphohistidine phosphatase
MLNTGKIAVAVLLLFRHAKAAQAEGEQRDFDRPLTERGRADSERAREILAKAHIDLALVSAARRTQETWEIAGRGLRPAPTVAIERELYLCSPARLIDRLRRIPETAKNVVAVGHNPCWHEVSLWLAAHTPGRTGAAMRAKFPTSAISVFHLPDGGWSALSPETAELTDFHIPRA